VKDLRFLLDAKDSKIKALDRELSKMRAKLEKTLSKMYLPSQDEVVEGLAGDILERGELNLMARVGGHQQDFQLNHAVNQAGVDMSGLNMDGGVVEPSRGGAGNKDFAEINKKFLQDLTEADERANRFRHQLDEAQKRKSEVEKKL
jgi:hypothetical protein